MDERECAAQLLETQRRLSALRAHVQQFTTELALAWDPDCETRYVNEGVQDVERFANS